MIYCNIIMSWGVVINACFMVDTFRHFQCTLGIKGRGTVGVLNVRLFEGR